MEIKLKPTLKQHLAWEALKANDIVLFGGGSGGGKTWLLAEKCLVNSYLYPGYRTGVGREELKRLMASWYVTWGKVCQYHNIPPEDWQFNGQYSYIQFMNGSRIDLLDLKYLPSDPLYERFGSLEYSDFCIEEAGEIDFRAFDILKTRIGRQNLGVRPTILLTANPKKNWLFNTFYLPWKNGTLPPGVAFVQSLHGDNPYLLPDYEKQLQSITDKSTRERLLAGNWEYEDPENAMIPFAVINDMFSNTFITGGKKYIVGDIARFGSDLAVITVWDGLRLIDYVTYSISSMVEIQNCINALRSKYQVPASQIVVDEDGIGGGVVDNLKCKGFVNNGTPTNPTYQNLKCECGYKLAELASKIYIACDMPEKEKEAIKLELGMLRTHDSDSEGKLRILPKALIKEYIGRSPDWLDVFTYRMFWETKPIRRHGNISSLVGHV
jgi:hypothetical protein